MKVDLNKISTEGRNPDTIDIDQVSTLEIIKKINNEDKKVALAVEACLDQISIVVDKVYEAFLKGGRLIYMGAGTSGRIGIMDAVECPPTFGVGYDMVIGLLAGGDNAFVKAKEGAEDSTILGTLDLQRIGISPNDFVIGIAASGRTPYVVSSMEYCKNIGVKTGCITTSKNTILASVVDYPIEAITGPEAITGSTRMKSGTAQKMICNMITTAAMIKMGKVYENLMIDVKATNEKLVARSENILMSITGCSREEIKILLDKYKTNKRVIFHYLTGEDDIDVIDKYLNNNLGNIRVSIKKYEEEKL